MNDIPYGDQLNQKDNRNVRSQTSEEITQIGVNSFSFSFNN